MPIAAEEQNGTITGSEVAVIADVADTTVEITTDMATSETTVEVTTDMGTTEIPVEVTTGTAALTTTTESTTYTIEIIADVSETAVEITTENSPTVAGNTMPPEVIKDKLSEQIRKILRHYQRRDPEGFPGAPIPDPLRIPGMSKNFGVADMTFFNMTVHGLSKFKVERVNVDLKKMQVSASSPANFFIFF